jgi:hypothetical protein
LADDPVRIEIAFAGGPVIAATVSAAAADALERAASAGSTGVRDLDTEDGRITVFLDRIAYVKRFARDARVGFGL